MKHEKDRRVSPTVFFCPVFYQSLFPYTKQPFPVYESFRIGLPYTKSAYPVYESPKIGLPYTKSAFLVYESSKLGLPYTKLGFLVYGPFGVETGNRPTG